MHINSNVFAVVEINHPMHDSQDYWLHTNVRKITVKRESQFHSDDSNEYNTSLEKLKYTVEEYRKANPKLKFGAKLNVEITP